MRTKRMAGMLVTLMLLTMAFCVMATPVSAIYTETTYASYKKTVWDGWNPHIVLGYYVPHDTLEFPMRGSERGRYRPFIGGVNYWVVANIHDHNEPQKWDYYSRSQVNSNWDRVELYISKSYVFAMSAAQKSWRNEIYITYYRR